MKRSQWTSILALQRGVEVAGSTVRLAQRLGIDVLHLRSYLNGTADIPVDVFLKVVDLLYPLEDMKSDPAASMHEDGLRSQIAALRNGGGADSLSHPFFAPDFLPTDRHELLKTALDAAMRIAGTDLGNIQLIDGAGDLRIEVQRGFSSPFLTFFERVSGAESACGTALKNGQQVFVEDVLCDPIFANKDSGRVMVAAGSRAVTSSPIMDKNGRIVGMLSTHHRRPTLATAVDLRTQQQIAQHLARHLPGT